jgi:hypothetical protein
MENREAIEALGDLLDTTRDYPHLDGMTMFGEAITLAISALEKQSRIITVTDAEGGLLASISDKDIIEENGVHVIISEE